MALEDTLGELERRRAGFKARRAQIEEELRIRRVALLAEEQAQIEDLVAKARAQGATLGQIKRAYGTKDHRTVSGIVANREAEIKYWSDELARQNDDHWFTLLPNTDEGDWRVQIGDVVFAAHDLADGLMLDTETPQWNEDFTVENETVRDFDGKTEEDDRRITQIAEALRKHRP